MCRKICNVVSTIVIIVLAAIACLFLLPNIFGLKTMAVISGSMEPSIPVGSIIVTKPIDNYTEIAVNDVISFKVSEETIVTHRVVEIDLEEGFISTKGDANEENDLNPIAFTQVIGKVVFDIPIVGFISIYAKTPIGIIGICIFIAIIITLSFLPDVLEENKKIEGACNE